MIQIGIVATLLLAIEPDVPTVAGMLEGQPVTVAAIAGMVLIVWLMTPLVKQGFTFSLQMALAAKEVSAGIAKAQERDADLARSIEMIQEREKARDKTIADHTVAIHALTGAVNHLGQKIDVLAGQNPPKAA